MKSNLIYDKDLILDFYDKSGIELFLIHVFYREKYNNEISGNKNILVHRELCSSKNLNKMMYMLNYGYFSLNSELIDNSNCLAVYSSYNSIDIQKASIETADTIMKQVKDVALGRAQIDSIDRADKLFLSQVNRNISYDYVHLDIDLNDRTDPYKSKYLKTLLSDISSTENVPMDDMIVIETRGGYHILIDVKLNKKIINNIYKNIPKYDKFTVVVMNKGSYIPLPGTMQAGFQVRLIDHKNL